MKHQISIVEKRSWFTVECSCSWSQTALYEKEANELAVGHAIETADQLDFGEVL